MLLRHDDGHLRADVGNAASALDSAPPLAFERTARRRSKRRLGPTGRDVRRRLAAGNEGRLSAVQEFAFGHGAVAADPAR